MSEEYKECKKAIDVLLIQEKEINKKIEGHSKDKNRYCFNFEWY